MKSAIKLARRALAEGEVRRLRCGKRDGVIIGSGYNRRKKKKNALAHAELGR